MSSRRDRGLLLSIRPHFADAILNGHKTIELRRTRPGVRDGACVFLYASAPRMAVVARARVASIFADAPANVWREHEHEIGISSSSFCDYFNGAETAYGLRLEGVTPLDPVSLSELRALGVEPPQSWRYLDHLLVAQISANATRAPHPQAFAAGSTR